MGEPWSHWSVNRKRWWFGPRSKPLAAVDSEADAILLANAPALRASVVDLIALRAYTIGFGDKPDRDEQEVVAEALDLIERTIGSARS